MKISMHIEFDSQAEAAAFLAGGGHVAQTTQPQVIPQPAPVAVAPVPTTAPVVAPTTTAPVAVAPAPTAVAPVAGGAPDHSTLAAAMQAYAKAHGAGAAKAMLAKYGAKKVTDVQAAHLAQILGEVQA